MSKNTLALTGWADRIRAAWQSSFDGIMECGRLLVEAKEQLEHGEWLQMIRTNLPFKECTAQRLMKISRDERLTNAANVPFLPRSRETLYELTKLPDEVFQKKIADGTINPEMQRQDITRVIKSEVRKVAAVDPDIFSETILMAGGEIGDVRIGSLRRRAAEALAESKLLSAIADHLGGADQGMTVRDSISPQTLKSLIEKSRIA